MHGRAMQNQVRSVTLQLQSEEITIAAEVLVKVQPALARLSNGTLRTLGNHGAEEQHAQV